jgi:hypothetical protein
MFYDVLMEKRAQQAQQDEQKPRLSLGQKAGVAGIGGLGAVGGAGGLALAAVNNKTVGGFFADGTKKDRAGRAQALSKYDSLRQRVRGLADFDIDSKSVEDLHLLRSHPDLPSDARGALDSLIDAKGKTGLAAPTGSTRVQAGRHARGLRSSMHDAHSAFEDALHNSLKGAVAERGVAIESINNRIFKRNRLMLGGSLLAGGLAAGYGAKKLFDRHNRRKRLREE